MKVLVRDIYTNLCNHPKRLLHVMMVANICKSLAITHKLESEDYYLAGLMHDYSKHNKNAFHEKHMKKVDFNGLRNESHLYHAYSAANYFKKHYNINVGLYQAILNHVYGLPNMDKLTQILFIADSIYLNGKSNTRNIYKAALKDLDYATYLAAEYNASSIIKKGQKVNIKQKETYNYYKEVNKF